MSFNPLPHVKQHVAHPLLKADYNTFDANGYFKVADNAKIKIDEKLGTVPMYSANPTALSPNNESAAYQPANSWQVDDPYTSGNEAPGK